jgi:hypothetical protein
MRAARLEGHWQGLGPDSESSHWEPELRCAAEEAAANLNTTGKPRYWGDTRRKSSGYQHPAILEDDATGSRQASQS